MDKNKIQKELCIMINHYIRNKNPDIYSKLREFYIKNHIFSEDEQNIDSILDLRYSDFPDNQFLLFLKTLTPKDDYPSLFRRMTSFKKQNEFNPNICNLDLLCSNQFHRDSIFSIEVDPLSRFFVTGSDDKTMKIISLPFFKEIITLQGHNDVISNIYFNYDISLLLSSSHDSTVRIWSLNNGKCLSVLDNITTSDIHYALFSPDGKLIAASCEDGSLFIWKTEDALQQKPPYYQLKSPELTPIVWLSFSPGSEFLCYVAEQNRVFILSISNNKTFELRPLTGNITYVSFSQRLYPSHHGLSPKLITFSAEEGTLSIFTIKNSSFGLQYVFKPSTSVKKGKICSLAWDHDDHLIVVVRQNSIVVYDSISGKTVSQLPEVDAIDGCYLLAANPKYTKLYAFVSCNGIFSVWDIHEIELLASCEEKSDVLFHEMKWSPCGRFLIASDNIGRVLIFCFTMNNHKCTLINSTSCNDQNGLNSKFLNYQVKTDLTFSLKCQKEEIELANKISEIDENSEVSPNRSHAVVVQQPPDPISIIYRKPLNPTVLNSNDDPSLFKNINDDNNTQPFIQINNSEINSNENTNLDVANDDLRNIAFDSESDLIPVLAPNDPSQFVVYEPFITLDKPYWIISISASVYVPQKGDQTLYIHSANIFDIISSNMSDFKFPPLLRCQIQKVQIAEQNNNCYFLIDLEAPLLDKSFEFQISYRFNDYCDYLFPISAMATYVAPIKNLEGGYNVEFRFEGHRYTGEVVSVRKDYRTNPYESITVSGLEAQVNISPWQILQYNGISTTNPYNVNTNYDIAAKAIESIVNKEEEFNRFYDMSSEICQNKSNIDFPVDLKFIIERLAHGWYRTTIALQDDIERANDNAKVIYKDQPDIIQLSDQLTSQCLDLIHRNVIRIQ
ncbi:hypothetical protein M9Y10_025282 [Tritrichomonas musculus]|uniref:Anaphase-promoting complex subunit 4-like WD40 domain-containing protein n=1 Tax=Tritrichomonas musculus TaxID=1915356 RepID=A0ABR2HA26_9EUKA